MTKGIKGTKGGEEEGPMREKEKENEKDTMDERRGMDEKNEVMALSGGIYICILTQCIIRQIAPHFQRFNIIKVELLPYS